MDEHHPTTRKLRAAEIARAVDSQRAASSPLPEKAALQGMDAADEWIDKYTLPCDVQLTAARSCESVTLRAPSRWPDGPREIGT